MTATDKKQRQAKKRAVRRQEILRARESTQSPTEVLSFKWNPRESVRGDRFLTPLYFHKQVLTRYLYDSRFECEFSSDTYGLIRGPEFQIPFGINKNGSVLCWLGDLEEHVPIRERFYWLVENKEPENELASEFFDAQIGAAFTQPPAIVRCLNALGALNAGFHRMYGVHLYRDRSIEERIEEARRYARILLNNVDDFKRFVSELNEIINENTNNTEVRRLLVARGVGVDPGTKGNKLLELAYKNLLKDTANLIAPFFYLYDLRLWADHSMGDANLLAVAAKLDVSAHDFQRLLEALVARITESANALVALLTNMASSKTIAPST